MANNKKTEDKRIKASDEVSFDGVRKFLGWCVDGIMNKNVRQKIFSGIKTGASGAKSLGGLLLSLAATAYNAFEAAVPYVANGAKRAGRLVYNVFNRPVRNMIDGWRYKDTAGVERFDFNIKNRRTWPGYGWMLVVGLMLGGIRAGVEGLPVGLAAVKDDPIYTMNKVRQDSTVAGEHIDEATRIDRDGDLLTFSISDNFFLDVKHMVANGNLVGYEPKDEVMKYLDAEDSKVCALDVAFEKAVFMKQFKPNIYGPLPCAKDFESFKAEYTVDKIHPKTGEIIRPAGHVYEDGGVWYYDSDPTAFDSVKRRAGDVFIDAPVWLWDNLIVAPAGWIWENTVGGDDEKSPENTDGDAPSEKKEAPVVDEKNDANVAAAVSDFARDYYDASYDAGQIDVTASITLPAAVNGNASPAAKAIKIA